MEPEASPHVDEREQTDTSLRVERSDCDQAIWETQLAIDEVADAVICRARERADRVLARARRCADQDEASFGRGRRPSALMARERALADETLRRERAAADEVVQAERAEQSAALAAHRRETDTDLLHERVQVDDALSTHDQFLGMAGHEIRNMLHAMTGFAELIESEQPCCDRARQNVTHARNIRRAGARMTRLVGDLVDVASVSAGVLVVMREPACPERVVEEAIEHLRTQAAARSISVAMTRRGPPRFAVFDPARILQVLVNLLSNAIKFTPAHGSVGVEVESTEEGVCFRVSDTGIGIPADSQRAIFKRFLQVEENDRRGAGLGLYISECIVKGHGGRIWAESKLGEGSTFSFTFPSPASPGLSPAVPSAISLSGG